MVLALMGALMGLYAGVKRPKYVRAIFGASVSVVFGLLAHHIPIAMGGDDTKLSWALAYWIGIVSAGFITALALERTSVA